MNAFSKDEYVIHLHGESAVNIEFYLPVSDELISRIQALASLFRQALPQGDVIPAYQSLTLFDPSQSCFALKRLAPEVLQSNLVFAKQQPRLIEIPVCYGQGLGPDLPFVAKHSGLTEQQVIVLHSQNDYLVCMLGFLPGFVYLSGLDQALHCPRKSTPAIQIPAGAVGIGGNQTGIYPVASPGGWQVIGQTPINCFAHDKPEPFIAKPLDRIRFVPISLDEFNQWDKN